MEFVRVYLCALSDPVSSRQRYEDLKAEMEEQGILLELSPILEEDLSAKAKAEDFNKALRSGRYAWIADVSGGDLANLCLPYLDYEAYANAGTYYAGFSDCTCIVNALATTAKKKALLFPLWNQSDLRQAADIFKEKPWSPLVTPLEEGAYWPRHARVTGGNIRCFLKLAGTRYMPACEGSYLLLESMSAGWNQFRSMAAHLVQSDALSGLQGIILGRFNRLEEQFQSRQNALDAMMNYLKTLCEESIPFFAAENIGHIENSEGIWISPAPALDEIFFAEQKALIQSDLLKELEEQRIEQEKQKEAERLAKAKAQAEQKAREAAARKAAEEAQKTEVEAKAQKAEEEEAQKAETESAPKEESQPRRKPELKAAPTPKHRAILENPGLPDLLEIQRQKREKQAALAKAREKAEKEAKEKIQAQVLQNLTGMPWASLAKNETRDTRQKTAFSKAETPKDTVSSQSSVPPADKEARNEMPADNTAARKSEPRLAKPQKSAVPPEKAALKPEMPKAEADLFAEEEGGMTAERLIRQWSGSQPVLDFQTLQILEREGE